MQVTNTRWKKPSLPPMGIIKPLRSQPRILQAAEKQRRICSGLCLSATFRRLNIGATMARSASVAAAGTNTTALLGPSNVMLINAQLMLMTARLLSFQFATQIAGANQVPSAWGQATACGTQCHSTVATSNQEAQPNWNRSVQKTLSSKSGNECRATPLSRASLGSWVRRD